MPQIGQRPGPGCQIWGCIGQVCVTSRAPPLDWISAVAIHPSRCAIPMQNSSKSPAARKPAGPINLPSHHDILVDAFVVCVESIFLFP